MRLLTIAYNYPPIRGPEAIQANRLIKYASEKGVDFDIITRNIGNGKKFKNKITTYGNVNRAFSLDNFYFKGIIKIIGNDLDNLPDSEVLWYPFALRKARKHIKKMLFDGIYTRSVPFTSHLIGLQLKNEFGLPWIAHFSDPWTDSPYIKYKSNSVLEKNLQWEKKIIEGADKLIFTSIETKELVMSKYAPVLLEKSYVLPHSYNPEVVSGINIKASKEEPHRISYIGNLYGNRSPKDLFKAVEIALLKYPDLDKKINIHFFGNMPNNQMLKMKDTQIHRMIKYHGEISYIDSQIEMAMADVLLNIDAPGDLNVFLPSKIIEYFAFDKPILSLTPANGTVNRILKEAGHISVENEEHELLSEILIKIAEQGIEWIDFDKKTKINYEPNLVSDCFLDIITV